MAHLYVNPQSDSLYLDVTAGDRTPSGMTEVAPGVLLHVDETGVLVAIEVLDLASRGGLHMNDLDLAPDETRPPLFDEIERVANGNTGGEQPRR